MPYITASLRGYRGYKYMGVWRTQNAADTAAASDPTVVSIQGLVADADIPDDALANKDWWVYDAPAVQGVNAWVEIQYGTSGKGFRLTFHAGAIGAEGNGWTVGTAGAHIRIDADARRIDLPEPGGSAADFLLALNSITGTYTLAATYLSGTTALDDLSAIGSQTWNRADGQSGVPTFAGGITAELARKAVRKGHPPLYTPRQQAAWDAERGMGVTFPEFVLEHAADVEPSLVDKVLEFPYQARRALRMAFRNEVTINGVAITLTDAQFIAWATFMRFGPADTSVITALGRYNREGLYDIFERSDDPDILTPNGPIAWVGLDTSQWTMDAQGNANAVPNRLTVAQIVPVLGTFPSKYLNIHDDSWLRSE